MKPAYVTDLIPSNGRKSFYGKAKIIEQDGVHYLKSYSTIVGSVDKKGKVHRFYDGKTSTTSAHIRSFLSNFAGLEMSNKEFYSLPCEKAPTEVTYVV